MEILFVIGLLIFGPALISWLFRAMKAGATVAVTGKSFDEAMGNIPPLAVRLVDKTIDDEPGGLAYKAIEVKGLFPVASSKEVAFVASVFDATDGEAELTPVICVIEAAQEPLTPAFFQRAEIGQIQPNQGFIKWIEIGKLVPQFLQAPYSGSRTLKVVVRLVDTNNEPDISMGFASTSSGVLWQDQKVFKFVQEAKGYREESEHRTESQGLSVKLAMSVATVDGCFDDSEGAVINAWVSKAISPFDGDRREDLKTLLNDSMKEAYEQSARGDLSVSPIVGRLNEITDDNQKFEAMELCFDVMAADGLADEKEMQLLRRLGSSLDLDMKELERIRDLKMMNLSSSIESAGSLEDVLGIDPDWDRGRVKSHLRKEFQKWNARINNLPLGDERDHAQKMLDLIGEARNKNG